MQPGHGKTLVAAATVGERGLARGAALRCRDYRGPHELCAGNRAGTSGRRSTRYADINRTLAQVAGFTIAAIGLWRLGRHLAGYGGHAHEDDNGGQLRDRGLLSLGFAGGLVPCWDAVVLIILAEAIGRLALGLFLLAAFSLGMAAVLVFVGILAAAPPAHDHARRPGGRLGASVGPRDRLGPHGDRAVPFGDLRENAWSRIREKQPWQF